MGPLIVLLALLLTGCGASGPDADLTADLAETTIQSEGETTLTVEITNQGDEAATGTITVSSASEQIQTSYPEGHLLRTTLYPSESVTRVFTVNGSTDTRRTDYEITASFGQDNQTHAERTTILTVTK